MNTWPPISHALKQTSSKYTHSKLYPYEKVMINCLFDDKSTCILVTHHGRWNRLRKTVVISWFWRQISSQ